MRDTLLRSISVTAVAPNASPSILMTAADVAMRVVVRNTGAALIFLAMNVNDLQRPGQSADRLAPDREVVYVLAPAQQLYGLAAGAGGRISVAASDAVPVSQGVV